MKESITNYLCTLSGCDYDILYEIVKNKYKKFIQLYWLLKDYSDEIDSIHYGEQKNENALEILAVFKSKNLKTVKKEILSSIKNDDNVSIEISGKDMYITILKEEMKL